MVEYKIVNAIVRIHGTANQEKIREATEIFLKKAEKCRKEKAKAAQELQAV